MTKNLRLVGAVCAFALVVGCSGGDKSDPASDKSDPASDVLATDGMATAIQDIVTRAALDQGSDPDLTGCPLGDLDQLIAKAPAELKATADITGDLFSYAYQPDVVGALPHLQCSRGDVGAYTGEAPDGVYHDGLTNELQDFILTFDDDTAHRGGTLVRFCASAIGVGGGDFCEADWYDDEVWIGVYIDGETPTSAIAQQWLIAILDDVVASVPRLAPTIEVAN
ncbi:hypothetical protein BH10ACT2_BH10ACT2_23080 [soil metagenome]